MLKSLEVCSKMKNSRVRFSVKGHNEDIRHDQITHSLSLQRAPIIRLSIPNRETINYTEQSSRTRF